MTTTNTHVQPQEGRKGIVANHQSTLFSLLLVRQYLQHNPITHITPKSLDDTLDKKRKDVSDVAIFHFVQIVLLHWIDI